MLRPSLTALALILACMAPAWAQSIQLDVQSAAIVADPATGEDTLAITFADAGKAALAQFTTEHVGGVVEIKVDGEVLSSPMLVEPILTGEVVVTGGASPLATSLDEIVRRLTEKKAQVEINLASDRLL